MKIIFSRHARDQMIERNLTENEIISTLSEPDKIILQAERKFKAVKLINKEGKKYLMVIIYRKTNSILRVITAFLTTKIKKYLK